MTATINASTTAGVVTTADTSGILQLQTNGTAALTVDASQRTAFVAGTAALPAITTTGDTNTGIFFPAADTIAFAEGGAEAMRIDSSGNVGIGTASPSQKLVLSNAGAGNVLLCENTTASIQTYLQSGGTSGVVGTLTNHPFTLFTNNTERMRIDSSGNLLVGTTSGAGRLTIVSAGTTSASKGIQINNSSGTELLAIVSDGSFFTGTAANSPFNSTTGSAANAFITSGGQLQRSTSSLKYKTDVHDATHGLADVLQLRPVTYKGTNDGQKVFGGLIAEEVHEAGLTEFVQYAEDGTPDALAYGNMVSLCIKAIQELKALVDTQASTITALQADVEALKGTA